MKKQSGIYTWAGPGTIRMIQMKYPGHKVDYRSLDTAYDLENLKHAKEKLGITDAWVTFSWGFSEKTEQEDYNFIRNKLDNFHQLGIKTHAYIQGPNLVLDDHKDKDYWARDYWDRLIPYHRGRKVTCPNNPYFQQYIQRKIDLALQESFDGIFVDNLYLGQFPLIFAHRQVSFFGCNCQYCQQKFKQETGFSIPRIYGFDTPELAAYQKFRTTSLMTFTQTLADRVHSKGKLFGTNSYDAKFDTQLLCGVDLDKLQQIQDYLLFENHDLPGIGRNNTHMSELIKESSIPVFVVSYKQGIGREKMFGQSEFDAIYTESKRLGYAPAYKASEFVDNKIWHNMDFSKIDPVKEIPGFDLDLVTHEAIKSLKFSPLARMYNRWYLNFMEKYYENRLFRRSFNWVYYRAIK